MIVGGSASGRALLRKLRDGSGEKYLHCNDAAMDNECLARIEKMWDARQKNFQTVECFYGLKQARVRKTVCFMECMSNDCE